MARQYGYEKLPLVECLRVLAELQPVTYSDYRRTLAQQFGVSERACKDAIGVLRAAGYIDSVPAASDGRAKLYSVTDLGRRVHVHPAGATMLRYARKLFTTCASTPTLQRRAVLARGLEPQEALREIEGLILSGAYAERIRRASGTAER